MANKSLPDKLRAWLPLVPLLLLLFCSYWLNLQVRPFVQPDITPRHDVDYAVDRLDSVALDAQGLPHFRLAAERLWHFPDDDMTHLERPHLTRFFPDRTPTEFTALYGRLNNRSEEVILQDTVVIRQLLADTPGERRFETEYLLVKPNLGWAETALPVRLTDPRNIINAVGMELDEKAHTVKLLNRVRAVHEPLS